MNQAVYRGFSRRKIFASKVLHYYLQAGIILLALAVGLLAYLCNGLYLFQLVTPGYLLRCLGVWLLLSFAVISVPLFIVFLCKKTLPAVIASLSVMFANFAVLS